MECKCQSQIQSRKEIHAVTLGFPVCWSSSHQLPGYDHQLYQINSIQAWNAFVHQKNKPDQQWIQVCSIIPQYWTAVVTQGRADLDQWVKKYKVSHSSDGVTWQWIDNGKEFEGNCDRNTQIRNNFSKPVLAKTIRIHPVAWNTQVSLRFDAIYLE